MVRIKKDYTVHGKKLCDQLTEFILDDVNIGVLNDNWRRNKAIYVKNHIDDRFIAIHQMNEYSKLMVNDMQYMGLYDRTQNILYASYSLEWDLKGQDKIVLSDVSLNDMKLQICEEIDKRIRQQPIGKIYLRNIKIIWI